MGRTKEKKTQERQKMKIGQESEVGGGGVESLTLFAAEGGRCKLLGGKDRTTYSNGYIPKYNK